MPWFVRNLLQASSPLRLYGWRGVRGAGRVRKKDKEASELWSQMGEDELLSSAPQFLRLQGQEGVQSVSVKAGKSHNTREQPIPFIKEERVKNNSSTSGKEFQERKDLTYRQFIKNLKMELNPQVVTKENQYHKVRNAVAMLCHLPYEEQLRLKQQKNAEVLAVLKNANPKISRCREGTIFGAAVREQYRSKDEFSVHLDIEGQPTVGFFVGGGSTGVVCVEPKTVEVVKDSHKRVASAYQQIIRESKLPPDLNLGPRLGGVEGVWSSLLVRSNQTGDLMARVSICGKQLDKGQIQTARDELVKGLTQKVDFDLHSLYLESSDIKGNKTLELLQGKPCIEEDLLGKKILLGPNSFFQGHHDMAATLVKVVRSKLKSNNVASMLDLCCGVGNFSLHLAENYRDCIGVDVTETSLAFKNAKINSLKNCQFITGKVGVIIPALVSKVRATGAEVVAVINPGRGGVDREVVEHLRSLPLLSSIVYVSCEPEDRQVVSNMLSLAKEDKKGKTRPFTLTEAIPIDMFPHTHHCEHVFVFSRKI